MAYTKSDTKNSIIDFLENGNLKTLYKEKFINRTGWTNDSKEFYSDVLSEIIISKNVYQNNNIEKISRQNTYNVNHTADTKNDDGDKGDIQKDSIPLMKNGLMNMLT